MLDRIATTVLTAIPNPDPQAPPGLEDKVGILLGFGKWIVIIACVAGVLLCAGRAAVAYRRGELGEVMGQLVGVGIACVLVGGATGFVGFLV